MAYPLHGKGCTVTVDGASANKVAELDEWSIDATLETAQDTQFGDNWHSHIVGLGAWSGSMSGSFDPSDTYQKEVHDYLVAAAPTGILSDARFNIDTGDYYSGTIIITGVSVSAGIGGRVEASYSFIGSGALTLTV
jgi:hypothetical protein